MATATEATLGARYGDEEPYTVEIYLRGLTPLLFNRFADLDAYAEDRVAKKKRPRKNEQKDYEAMVWRDDAGDLALPTINVIASLLQAARYFGSPIAAKGSATPTLREALVAAEEHASFNRKDYDCVDFRLARNGDTKRTPKPTWRPRLEKGWTLSVHLGVVVPELYSPSKLLEVVTRAGITSGVGDGRALGFGRFAPDGFEIAEGLAW